MSDSSCRLRKKVIVSRLKNTGARWRKRMIYIPGKFHVKYWYVGKGLRDLDPFWGVLQVHREGRKRFQILIRSHAMLKQVRQKKVRQLMLALMQRSSMIDDRWSGNFTMLSYQPPPFTTLLICFKLFSGVRLLMYSVKIALFADTRIH